MNKTKSALMLMHRRNAGKRSLVPAHLRHSPPSVRLRVMISVMDRGINALFVHAEHQVSGPTHLAIALPAMDDIFGAAAGVDSGPTRH